MKKVYLISLGRNFLLVLAILCVVSCSSISTTEKKYQPITYKKPVSKIVIKPISVGQFSGHGITALYAYLPFGSQVELINPITHKSVSAKIIGQTPNSERDKLLLSSDALKSLGLHHYPNSKILMRVKRSGNIAIWQTSVQQSVKGIKDFVNSSSQVVKSKRKRLSVKAGRVQYGRASYYARHFHGKKTASGERFNMNEMTCAHRSLPFGVRVRITNKGNGRSVILRVNDRGPYSKERIVDVSYAAAKKLGMIRSGTADVKLEVIE